jgi:hypothetical protein
MNHGFALEHQQKNAWSEQIRLLQAALANDMAGTIYFEFSIPRMGKRADVLLLIDGVVFVLEFKVGANTCDRSSIEQVVDYALDLKNFHRGSHTLRIVPILIPTEIDDQNANSVAWGQDQVAQPICIPPTLLSEKIRNTLTECPRNSVDAAIWASSGYQPTPTIVEAALALYKQHDVHEITRSEASASSLTRTAKRVEEIIEIAKRDRRKAICFITGVPGAGKTLAGLNIATSRAERHLEEHAVFLSGNGPLVDVLREALARDKASRMAIPRSQAYREVSAFVQNIHHFRDDALNSIEPPIEKVVIFDEAQRAWNREMATKFMRQKRQHPTFDMSEPAFLVGAMDRHLDWCVVICLVGGGQEINTGEAGLSEWLAVMQSNHPDWDVHVSDRLGDSNHIWNDESLESLKVAGMKIDDRLHLGVSIRSFRAESVSEFVGFVVDNKPHLAKECFEKFSRNYPIPITRSLDRARSWLRDKARGSERYGLTASSGANRLRPDGIWIKSKIDAPLWFLNGKDDIRSSFYLEEVATEFDVQGLELDWTCVAWDLDFRRTVDAWESFSFKGTRWQRVNAPERKLYLKNAYRVLLTRARQGTVIYIPEGNSSDPTRPPQQYDQIFSYLVDCGLQSID